MFYAMNICLPAYVMILLLFITMVYRNIIQWTSNCLCNTNSTILNIEKNISRINEATIKEVIVLLSATYLY